MFRRKRDRQFSAQASPEELAFATFLTLFDLLSIVDKKTADKVAQRIRKGSIEPGPEMFTGTMTKEGVAAIRRLFVEACG